MSDEFYENGTRILRSIAGVSIAAMSPDAHELLETALEDWSEHKRELPAENRESVFSFAYWLFRYSGLIEYSSDSLLVIKPAVRELLCQRCDLEYPVWFAPNELWNRVAKDGEHFLCPNCFAVLAEARGASAIRWQLIPDNFKPQ